MGSDVQGIELRAEAKWEDMIYDHFVIELEDQIATQERLVTYAGVLSPLIAMRSLSASLAGTIMRTITPPIEPKRGVKC